MSDPYISAQVSDSLDNWFTLGTIRVIVVLIGCKLRRCFNPVASLLSLIDSTLIDVPFQNISLLVTVWHDLLRIGCALTLGGRHFDAKSEMVQKFTAPKNNHKANQRGNTKVWEQILLQKNKSNDHTYAIVFNLWAKTVFKGKFACQEHITVHSGSCLCHSNFCFVLYLIAVLKNKIRFHLTGGGEREGGESVFVNKDTAYQACF